MIVMHCFIYTYEFSFVHCLYRTEVLISPLTRATPTALPQGSVPTTPSYLAWPLTPPMDSSTPASESWEDSCNHRDMYRYPRTSVLGKNLAKPNYIPLVENIRQCSKGCHILYAIVVTQDKKIRVIKFSPMRAGGKIGENFYIMRVASTYSRKQQWLI